MERGWLLALAVLKISTCLALPSIKQTPQSVSSGRWTWRMSYPAAEAKRLPFNSWGGKRSYEGLEENKRTFNTWGGKRFDSSEEDKRTFHNLGGKRNYDDLAESKRTFNNWGGKRDDDLTGITNYNWEENKDYDDSSENKRAFHNWGGKRNYDDLAENKRTFHNWGGKRNYNDQTENMINNLGVTGVYDNTLDMKRSSFNSWGGKRAINNLDDTKQNKRNFHSWGGKRAYDDMLDTKRSFNSWGGKRTFRSWGGKRSELMVKTGDGILKTLLLPNEAEIKSSTPKLLTKLLSSQFSQPQNSTSLQMNLEDSKPTLNQENLRNAKIELLDYLRQNNMIEETPEEGHRVTASSSPIFKYISFSMDGTNEFQDSDTPPGELISSSNKKKNIKRSVKLYPYSKEIKAKPKWSLLPNQNKIQVKTYLNYPDEKEPIKVPNMQNNM